MAMVKIDVISQVPDWNAGVARAIKGAIAESGDAALHEMQRRTPVVTGKLKAGLAVQAGDTTAVITSAEKYWVYVDKGTRPHEIRPVRARALAFTVQGSKVFAKVVHHPGTRGKEFVSATESVMKSRIPLIFIKHIQQEVSKA